MALTTTQVNQAFLGLLGRPATGAEAAKFAGQLDAATLAQTLLTDASFKNELSVETLSFKTVDLLNTDPAAFVESLYTALLGRASDAEGKAFWLSVAGATPNRADVVAQFIAAVKAQEGTADANAFASIQAEDKALASAWVESLYNNLAGRASDAEGLDFWTNAIVSFAMTPAQVAASFAAALALQGNTTEDGQNFAAKLGVADNFTANFKDFNSLVTANEKAEQLKNLVTMMNGVNKDSQVDQYVEEITKNVNEFQNIKAIQFTTSDEDDLGIDPETGESNLTGAANFTGTYNLTDATKGTIQSTDSATGTEAHLTDTLTVNVTGYDKTTHADFDLGELPSTTSIEKLVINNGAANVSGNLSDFEYINVNGTGSFNIDASAPDAEKGLKDISLNSAAKTDNTFTATNTKVASFKSAAGNDTITLGEVSKSLNTGAGDDIVNASLGKGATADLGAGNDEFTGTLGEAAKLNAGAGDDTLTVSGTTNYKLDKNGIPVPDKNGDPIVNASIEIDGGTGNDTLDLSTLATDNVIAGNGLGIKSIRGIENIKIGTEATLTASAISGQKIELSSNAVNSVLTLKAENGVDLSKISKAANDTVDINVNSVKSGNVNLSVANTSANTIKETVTLAKDANKVSVKSFEKSYDKMAIDGVAVANVNGTAQLFSHNASGKATIFNANSVTQDTIYFVNLKDTVSKTSINNLLKDANSNFDAAMVGKSFYIVATDSTDVPADVTAAKGQGKNSTAKIYKVEVGKDGKVGKVDQMATVNVADKAQLSAVDFGAGTPTPTPTPVPTPTEEVNLSNKPVASDGSVTVLASDFTGHDANAAIKVDLPATAKKVNLDGVNVKAVQVSGLQANAEVVIGSGSVIDTLSSTENVALKYTVAAGAKVSTIIGHDLNDIIDTSAASAGSITGTINGGAGNDTLIISGDGLSNLTSLQSIEKIVVSGTSISAKALSGVTTTLSTNKATGATLEVKATAADANINLANLVQDTTDSGDVSLNITGVASNAKVALGAADTKETVNLGASLGVVVTGVKAGDTVVSDNFAGITGSFAELKGTIEAGKAYFTSNTTVTDAASAAAALSTQLATITSGNAIVAVNNGANAYVFAVNGAAANKLTLVATLDNTFSVQDSIANGTLAFDGESPVPPVEPTVDALVSYNKTEDRLEAKVSGNAALTATKDSVSGGDTNTKLVVSADANSTINFDKSVSDYAKAITTLEIRGTGAVTLNDAKLPNKITTITDTGANATINLAATTANATLKTINLGDGNDTLNLTGGRYNALDTIDAGSGDDTINLNAVRTGVTGTTTVNLGDGADSLILGANFNATSKTTNVSGGAGDDIFDLSAVTNAARLGTFTFKGEEGNDTVIFGAADYTSASLTLETIEAVQGATSGDVTTKIKLETIAEDKSKVYTAKQTEIKGDIILVASSDASGVDTTELTGTGNVTIDLTTITAPASATSITGSVYVNETIDLGNKAFTKSDLAALEGIDAIKTTGATASTQAKIAATAFGEYHGVTTINGELEVSGAGATFTNLDLSKVANGTANVTISGVTNGDNANNVTLTLTKAAGIVDTVKLGALNTASGDLIISGAQSGDKVDVKTLASSGFALWSKGVKNAADTAYYVNDDALKAKIAAGTELAFTDLFTEASGAAKSFAFVQTNNGINIYEASGDGTGATQETVSLIGTIVGVASVEQTVNDIKVVSVF